MKQPPIMFLGLPPVIDAKHDGEGGGGQHLPVVVVVQAVGRCQGKSVANLGGSLFVIMNEDRSDEMFDNILTITALHWLFI